MPAVRLNVRRSVPDNCWSIWKKSVKRDMVCGMSYSFASKNIYCFNLSKLIKIYLATGFIISLFIYFVFFMCKSNICFLFMRIIFLNNICRIIYINMFFDTSVCEMCWFGSTPIDVVARFIRKQNHHRVTTGLQIALWRNIYTLTTLAHKKNNICPFESLNTARNVTAIVYGERYEWTNRLGTTWSDKDRTIRIQYQLLNKILN